MDKTKSKLAAFFDNDDEEPAFPPKPVDDQKLSHYAQGTVRKSKREKEKEAAEAKRKEEEENAARAYAEFLETFQGEEAGRKKGNAAFVKAGEESAYTPASRGKGESSRMGGMFEELSAPPSPPPVAPKPKGKRAMDSFLEEIKRDQASRESKFSRHAIQGRSVTSMAAYEGQSGSKDRGDPETSNIFVANLPQYVNEQSLGTFFARIGPVGSVKIMWPRGDASIGPGADMTASRRTKSAGLSGFVSYMKRKHAEQALRELDGFDWGGSILRVGWSKAVPMAAKPMFIMNRSRSNSGSRSHSRSRSRSPKRYRSRSPVGGHNQSRHSRSRSYSHSRSRSRSYSRHRHSSRRRSYSRPHRYDSRSHSPRRRSRTRSPSRDEEEISEQFIRTVAAEVKGHNAAEYERILREREESNPKYAFLKRGHRKYKFYRSLVEQSRELAPEFDDEGYNSVYSTDSAEDSEREHGKKNQLGKLARRRFETMLRALSGKRGEMARCMAFSLEHAEASSEVVDIIISSLLVDGTPVPRKVARLHLICDILHNSAAPLPMAWKFRQEFQARLGLVFDHFSTIYHSFPGRITAETFKKQIIAVVDIWEDWIVFPPDFTSELRARLEGNTALAEEEEEEKELVVEDKTKEVPVFASKFKASSFKPAEEAATTVDDNDGEPMDEESDIDGEPLTGDTDVSKVHEKYSDDVDGEPIDDVDGIPIDDVDGIPMEDVDGEPMDDDIDGAPIAV